MFEKFTRTEIKTSGARIVTVHGGTGCRCRDAGNPLPMRAGIPAPRLAQVSPSSAPTCAAMAIGSRRVGSPGYLFLAMAQDQIEVMAALASTVTAAGHDRGARVLHRMTLATPTRSSGRRSSTSSPSTICSIT
jgi:haloacetate dehalogenase